MRTKLTINIEQNIIDRSKVYARLHRTSLSKIIENYLQKITEPEGENEKITPLVKSLSGIIDLPKDFDHKKEYTEYLVNKYK